VEALTKDLLLCAFTAGTHKTAARINNFSREALDFYFFLGKNACRHLDLEGIGGDEKVREKLTWWSAVGR